MDSKIHIFYLSRTSKYTGAEATLFEIISKLDPQKYLQSVILPDSAGLFFEKLKSIDVRTFVFKMPFLQLTKNPFRILWFCISIIRINIKMFYLLKRHKASIVFCNSFQDSVYVFLAAKFNRRLKLFVYIKNILDTRFKKKLRAKFLSVFADKIIAVSNKASEDYIKFTKQPDKLEVIYDGICCSGITRGYNNINNGKNKKISASKSFVILNIGNLSILKGQELLIKAVLRDELKKLGLRVFLLGDAYSESDLRYRDKLEDIIKTNKLENKVFLEGYQQNVKPYFENADIFIHCPVLDDAFPRVLLEAMCEKRIIIATQVGGIPEIIEDLYSGFLVEPYAEALAEKILYVYSNYSSLGSIRENAFN